ncbi:MAG: hypothetical protein IKH56_06075 [Oscillospiraceae bacterium]|nr:hypothetical protein [Oscillospiraceae bacterium]
MGDDYMYGTFGQQGILKSVFSYYFTGNGRWFINIIDSFLLRFDRYIFIFILPLLTILLAYLLWKLVSEITQEKNNYVYIASLVLVSLISIQMTCETTYWFTGAMNYLIPMVVLLAALVSVLKLNDQTLSTHKKLLYSCICFLSCLTMEQYCLMSFGWMVLIWGYQWIKTKHISIWNMSVLVFSVFALASVLLAPGNFVRVSNAVDHDFEYGVIQKAIDLVYYDFYSPVPSVFIFILNAAYAFFTIKEHKYFQSVLSFVSAITILLVFRYSLFTVRWYLILFTVIITLVSGSSIIIRLLKTYKFIFLISLFIVCAGSQMMLLLTTPSGFRTSCSWIVLYIILILIMLTHNIKEPKLFPLFISICCLSISPYLGIVALLFVGVIIIIKRPLPAISVAMAIITIICSLSDEVIGYYKNRNIHINNAVSAISAGALPSDSTIEVLSYCEPQYGWNNPPLSDFHERYFRAYYGIPDSIKIQYEGALEE